MSTTNKPYPSTSASLPDQVIGEVDKVLRTLFGQPITTDRAKPVANKDTAAVDSNLSSTERKHAARLMRINHAGEVSAQALYQGQALTARDPATKAAMEHAAAEENDHLVWCEERVRELGETPSKLNPLFHAGSFAIGALAGAIGDKVSLGFVAETERQVVQHLDQHLSQLPEQDANSRAIVEQMKTDEAEHGEAATQAGGVELPPPVKKLMQATSKIMTKTSYWI